MKEFEWWKAISRNNEIREEAILRQLACRSSKAVRRFPEREEMPDIQNIRPAFFHDTDRIIHSLAYARYIDKTQVFFLFDNDHITHRVLHVQLVSKIARTLGRCLGLNEDLIEAIALGHDLGHVPFGHDGEKYLNRICEQYKAGVFCHNAQSVRFLMELENKGKGLNLTLQVLDGILCHNGEIIDEVYEPKWGKSWDDFLYEYHQCFYEKGFDKTIRPMTLEGCVMRISDIIAYIGRDIEDAILLNLIRREDIPSDITMVLGDRNDKIVKTLTTDLIANSYGKNYLAFSNPVNEALKKLKDFNYKEIYGNELKCSQDARVETMFRVLFDGCLRELQAQKYDSPIYKVFLNNMEEEYISNNSKEKVVLDYIAGMTDGYFSNEYTKMVVSPVRFGMSFSAMV